MKNTIIRVSTNTAPLPLGPYSQAIIFKNYLLTSGQIPIDPKLGTIPKDITEQTILTLNNLKSIIKSSGFNVQNIIKTTVFLINLNDLIKVNQSYEKFFLQHQSQFPARSCIEVSRLPKDVKIEIEAIAIR